MENDIARMRASAQSIRDSMTEINRRTSLNLEILLPSVNGESLEETAVKLDRLLALIPDVPEQMVINYGANFSG